MFALTSPLYLFRCTDGRRYCADPEGEFPGKVEQATHHRVVFFTSHQLPLLQSRHFFGRLRI